MRRYLAAFGPASVKDIATWSGLTGVREIVERLRAGLRTFRDENGVELFDVPDAPLRRPGHAGAGALPAGVRQRLPLPRRPLADRRPADRPRFGSWDGRFFRMVLVGGFIRAIWRPEDGDVVVRPVRRLSKKDTAAVQAEGRRLATFLGGGRRAHTAGVSGTLYAGASGFSYPSWKGGFYPADAKAEDFLRLYAERVNTVELNNTFYRVPPDGQFDRWAAQVPDGFRFAVTMTRSLTSFGRVARWTRSAAWRSSSAPSSGRCGSRCPRPATTGSCGSSSTRSTRTCRSRSTSATSPGTTPRWQSTLDARGVASVERREGATPFRYLRLREPPYDEAALAAFAAEIRPLLAEADVYAFFRHEDEPTAPLYAERLRALVEE